jgi:hypothetical protein
VSSLSSDPPPRGCENAATNNPSETNSWWQILLIGLLLFVVGVVVFTVTGNHKLFPMIALTGNFLVPVSYVAFFYERRQLSRITLVSVARAFFLWGGVMGVFRRCSPGAGLRSQAHLRIGIRRRTD